MPAPSTYLILYTGILTLAVNGLFAKGIPLNATNITLLRSVVAVLAIFFALTLFKRLKPVQSKQTLLGIYGIGIFMGLHWVTFFHSMQISTIAIGMLSLFTFPIMTVFMEAALHKQWPHWQDLLSAAFVLIGIALIIANEPIQFDSNTLHGTLWGMLSALLFASRNVLQKYFFANVSSDNLMLHQMLAIIVMLLFFIDLPDIQLLNSSNWLAIITLGLVSTAGAHTLIVISYKRLPAKTVAMISCLQPVIGALFGWLFINEQPSLSVIIGGIIILAVALYESLASKPTN